MFAKQIAEAFSLFREVLAELREIKLLLKERDGG